MKRTVLLAAEPVAVLVLVAQDVGKALLANDVFGCPTRDALGSRIPVHDLAIEVGDIDVNLRLIRDCDRIPEGSVPLGFLRSAFAAMHLLAA